MPRKQRGVLDEQGKMPSHPTLKGDALLAAGTVNQTGACRPRRRGRGPEGS